MEEAVRRYAQRVLMLHLLLLAAVVVLVVVASREIYLRTRQQVLEQAQARQELLTAQTAQAVQDHYASILANLQLIKRFEEGERPRPAADAARGAAGGGALPAMRMAIALWTQLEGRAEQLLVIRRDDMRPVFSLPRGPAVEGPPPHPSESARPAAPPPPAGQARDIIDRARPWLLDVHGPAVSRFLQLEGGGANLVAVPFLDEYLIVAVVPVAAIEKRFLDAVNREATMSATLLDSDGHTMATSDRTLIGGNVFRDVRDPATLDMLRAFMSNPRLATARIEDELVVGNTALPPRMVTAAPIDLLDPATNTRATPHPWTLLVSSHLSEVDAVVKASFGRSLIWAIVVGLILSAILVSTALQTIRARVRVENLRNEAIRRELDQARRIQLAWLPTQERREGPVRIAGVNQAANHISGDFYDWFDLPDGRTVVTIGDVTGHGMSAAFLMATTQLLVRNTMPRLLDPGECLREVNRQLCSQVFSGQFVTMLILLIDLRQGTLEAATAGHFPPLVSNGTGFYPLKLQPQLVLGIVPDERFPSERFDLPPSGTIVLYTDGVLDAADPAGRRFGADNLLHALAVDPATPGACIEQLLDAIGRFRGAREIVDDLTIVAVRVESSTIRDGAPAPEAAAV